MGAVRASVPFAKHDEHRDSATASRELARRPGPSPPPVPNPPPVHVLLGSPRRRPSLERTHVPGEPVLGPLTTSHGFFRRSKR